ncbi:MAG: DUF202 domain-containing protein [Phycisphaeraceae bacterium]|nr:MAG: DUF202 domain-containing protein [Phycisphaeraceae bacterium]
MLSSRYPDFREEEPLLRDFLAADRTILSNERTLLAYMRTGLALVIVGGSAVKFFEHPFVIATGWVFIASAAITFFYGVRSYRQTQRRILDAISRGPRAVRKSMEDGEKRKKPDETDAGKNAENAE